MRVEKLTAGQPPLKLSRNSLRRCLTTPKSPPSFSWFGSILMDSVLHRIAQRIEHVAVCTKSIKLHRLLLLDSGLCIAKPWMLCICYCTKSIKLQRLLLLDSGLCTAKAMDALHLLLYQFHQSPTIGVPFYCMPWGLVLKRQYHHDQSRRSTGHGIGVLAEDEHSD